MKKPKLTIELIPKSTSYINVRTILPKSQWDRLRKKSYEDANFKCEICGDSGLNQGYKHPLECHEIWIYQSDGTQYLKGLISLCPKCHLTKHIGRSLKFGKKNILYKHIAKVNKWTKVETENYVGFCFQEHKERSKIDWVVNVSILTSKFGVDENLIEEGLRKPCLGKPTWKKKKRKKKKVYKKKNSANKRPRKTKPKKIITS